MQESGNLPPDSPPAPLQFVYDDGGYGASGVTTADQLPVVRAIAICLDRRPAYRDIHRQYVALLAGQGFTPAGRVSSRRQQKRGSGPPGPALERRLKRQVCEDLLAGYEFGSQDLRACPLPLPEAHDRYRDCVAEVRDRKGNSLFTALVGRALRDTVDRRAYRWDRERVPWWAVGQAARTGGTIASDIRQRKAFNVWILAASAA